MVTIDGSKFKAVNNRERNYTPGKIERRERELEESIQRYLDALETADRTQPEEMQAKTGRLHSKIQKMRQRLQSLQVIKAELETVPDRQISQTDPDARAMTTYSAKGTAMVGYNVQAAVDTKNHLIVAHEVTKMAVTGHNSAPWPWPPVRPWVRGNWKPSLIVATTAAKVSRLVKMQELRRLFPSP
jgi:hypothetical protein